MKIVWWVVIGAGIAAIIGAIITANKPAAAPLNASGYTYPSTAGA